METQPPGDLSALVRAIEELQAQMIEVRKQISDLTNNPHKSYYQNLENPSQGQIIESRMPVLQEKEEYGNNKNDPPYIPHLALLQCVRCEHTWSPRTRRPKKCPSCKAPWWFLPRWRWGTKKISKA